MLAGSDTSPAACSTESPSRPRRGLADGRAKMRTFSPRSTSLRTRLSPTKPVAPVTRFMKGETVPDAASGGQAPGGRALGRARRYTRPREEQPSVEVYLDHLKGERAG